ncbi:hypothetical protein ACJX0J_008334, partial [Zea mays]
MQSCILNLASSITKQLAQRQNSRNIFTLLDTNSKGKTGKKREMENQPELGKSATITYNKKLEVTTTHVTKKHKGHLLPIPFLSMFYITLHIYTRVPSLTNIPGLEYYCQLVVNVNLEALAILILRLKLQVGIAHSANIISTLLSAWGVDLSLGPLVTLFLGHLSLLAPHVHVEIMEV